MPCITAASAVLVSPVRSKAVRKATSSALGIVSIAIKEILPDPAGQNRAMPPKARRSHVLPSREFLIDVTNHYMFLVSADLLRAVGSSWLLHKPAIDDRPTRSPYFEYAAMFTPLSRERLASDGFRTGGWLNLRAGDKEGYGECPT